MLYKIDAILDKLSSRLDVVFGRLRAIFYGPRLRSVGRRFCWERPYLVRGCRYVDIGDDVLIRKGLRLELLKLWSLKSPALRIGNNVNIEQNVHIVCASRIVIGNNVSITGNCAIVDVVHPYDDIFDSVKIGARVSGAENLVEIGDNSFIGYAAVLLPNTKVGRNCIIGANSVLSGNFPDYSVIAGVPAKIIKQYNHKTKKWEKAK